ncbi:MAG TPA: type I secretion system permease/ATPase [Burkholderiaceae bacterium]|jgi:PrtD family type I secretion system ABC transporter|nr:type I secretion system permease/ATPase [Burkholderiaceae bacterium]
MADQPLPGAPPVDPVRAAISANRPLLASAFLFSAIMSVLALTTSFYMLQVYDRVLTSRSEDTLLLLTIISFGAIGVFAVLDSLRLRLLQRIGMRVGEALSAQVLRAMVATTSQLGGVAARSGLRDVETIRNFIGSPALGAFMDAPFIIVYLVVLTLLHPLFLAIVIVGGAILVTIALINQRTTNTGTMRAIGLQSRAHEFAEDGLRNADVLEGMGMSATFVAAWRKRWLNAQRTQTEAADRDSGLSSLSRAVRLLIQIVMLGAGALLILDFRATGGIMIGASIIGARALAPIETLVSTWKSVIAVRLAWRRTVELLQRAPRRDEGMALPAPSGKLQVVNLSYGSRAAGRVILQGVGFEIAAGEALGIIGPSASGKSTLLRLLVGAWPCSSGVVRLDGADIYSWPRAELSQYVGYLPQDVELFDGTVRENIARMHDGDPNDVVRAAQRARAHDMILGLPKGYDTDIGGTGHKLSGGQAQRIGFARALYGDPRLIVLDEPNSNLDATGEEALLMSLGDLKQEGVTVVVVAHRPSILNGVDKMLVLRSNGTPEAFGPRAEVLAQYAKRAAPQQAQPQPQRQQNVVTLSPVVMQPEGGGKP